MNHFLAEGRGAAVAVLTTFRGKISTVSSFYEKAENKNAQRGWISSALAVPAAGLFIKGH